MKKLSFLFLLIAGGIFCFSASAQLTYKDVAPIFYARCTPCHHPGGGTPFSMMSYNETLPWATAIETALQNGTMPPWSPDTTYSRFLHERTITAPEKSDLISWITNGTQMGDTSQFPLPPVYEGKYQLQGTPDLILQMPVFTSNATPANDSYVCFSFPTGLTQDRYLRAYEIIPGNPDIVHHVVVTVDSSGTTTDDLSGSCFNPPGDFSIGGYAPGAPASIFPSKSPLKSGIKIPAGSNIVLQLHYPEGSGGQVDSTKMRLYFYPQGETGIREIFVDTYLQNWTFFLPANTVSTVTADYTVPTDVSIFAAFPHSHKVCTSIVNYAFQNNDTIPLIRVNKWDFEWQGFYTYPNLVKVPAGYKLFSSHVYDNTSNNPYNPNNPPQLITPGPFTSNEMLFDAFQWMFYEPGDELIDIGELLATDELLTGVSEPKFPAQMRSFAYPNPFHGKVKIGYEIDSPSQVSVSVFNIYGSAVRNFPAKNHKAGDHSLEWDGKNDSGASLPSGVYFYTIHAGNQTSSGMLMWIPQQ
ncbi:MAG: hypothetical protein COA57_11375 [Flavobacteriales bacterium]|nr:MAG: hypothetical protein COA57_11375 [Flavobacteriales bacterium]